MANSQVRKVQTKDFQEPIYYITFEDYLQPKKVNKTNKQPLLLNDNQRQKPELRLKLLEHPVLVAGRKTKWRMLKETVKGVLNKPKEKKLSTSLKNRRSSETSPQRDCHNIRQFAMRWYEKTTRKRSTSRFSSIKLPKFLAFLRARNDDGLCKRKSGFEIYCEMASIHGFINFVGSTTPQRAFWCFVIFVAISMSAFILLLSHLMNSDTPTILYTETTQHPTWDIPFPAVTICNLNRVSKSKAIALAERFQKTSNLTVPQLLHLFRLVLYTFETIETKPEEFQILEDILEKNDLSFSDLQDKLTPNCENGLLRCKWKGRFEICQNIFKRVNTSYAICCSFNAHAWKENNNKRPDILANDDVEYTTSCGHHTGLSVLINPDVEDYQLASRKTTGLMVYIHGVYDFTDTSGLQSIITPTSVNYLSITPQQTHATDYITSVGLRSRRCFLRNERKLFHFRSYSQVNCLVECRSSLLYEKCRCTLANWPRKANWTVCGLKESDCVLKNRVIYKSSLESFKSNYRHNHNAATFICDCYPLCDFNMYAMHVDSGRLDRQFSLTDKRFFKGVNITNQILLHVFYGDLHAERLRQDVYENWLTFIGTFGGITGLHMGYSFVSGFEMIFFAFVRPACNWLTKKQIRYRIKRRQKKALAEAEKKRKMEEEKEKQDRIEAFLRMRAHCPGY